MSRICRYMEDSGKHRFHGLEHDSKMRLFKTYSHTSTLRGLTKNAKAEKWKQNQNAKVLGWKAEGSKTSRAKPQAIAKKTYQSALRTKPDSCARNGHGASPCGGDVDGRKITRKIPPGKQNRKPRPKTNIPRRNKFKTGKTGSNTRGQWRSERQLLIATSAPQDSCTSMLL